MLAAFQGGKSGDAAGQPEAGLDYTYYDYLELPPGASPQTIEQAYTNLMERFGCGNVDGSQDLGGLIRAIHAAYEALSDPQKRSEYDAKLAQEAAMADAELKAALDREVPQIRRRVQEAPAPLARALSAIAA